MSLCDNIYRAVLKKCQLEKGKKKTGKVKTECVWLVCEKVLSFLFNCCGKVKYDPTELLPHLA